MTKYDPDELVQVRTTSPSAAPATLYHNPIPTPVLTVELAASVHPPAIDALVVALLPAANAISKLPSVGAAPQALVIGVVPDALNCPWTLDIVILYHCWYSYCTDFQFIKIIECYSLNIVSDNIINKSLEISCTPGGAAVINGVKITG